MTPPTATLISLAREFVTTVWRQHYRIPESAYWLVAGLVGVGFLGASSLEIVGWTGLFAVAVVGIARWHLDRRKSVALVLTRFSTVRGDEGMGPRIQELVMTHLQDKLSPHLLGLIHEVPAVVGPAGRDFAARLRHRLRALYLVHGRIDPLPGGGHAVFARVVQPSHQAIWHYDWFTRDRTPARPSWSALFQLLTPTKEIIAEEYPLEFATELEAVVRGLAGQVALAFEDYDRAESLLREAIAVAPDSTSHQVDQLRLGLARALNSMDRRDEALALLRDRAAGADPSPELLRTLHGLLGPQPGTRAGWDDEDQLEAIEALRRALDDQPDPQRDQSLYNLAMTLVLRDDEARREGIQILEYLMKHSPFYRGTWYVPFRLGGHAWESAGNAQEAEDGEAAARLYSQAARLYSRAIRKRPRFRLFMREGRTITVLRRFPPSPQMYANARDAHDRVGHKGRAWWHERRFQRTRNLMVKRGDDGVRSGDWEAAYANYDWATVGRWDELEVTSRILRAIASEQLGESEHARRDWLETLDHAPVFAMIARAVLVRDLGHSFAEGVPGDEPTDDESVRAWLADRGLVQGDDAE